MTLETSLGDGYVMRLKRHQWFSLLPGTLQGANSMRLSAVTAVPVLVLPKVDLCGDESGEDGVSVFTTQCARRTAYISWHLYL